jgi:predicted peroxiredoxin
MAYAVRLGATVVLKRKVEKVDKPEVLVKRRPKEIAEGILEAEEVVEIVTSAKGVKTYKRKNKKKPAKKKK